MKKSTRKCGENAYLIVNKKVLLHECKRHTTCDVASAHYAGGGTLSQFWGVPCSRSGGTLSQVQGRGVLHPDLVRGYPRYPPSRPGMGYPPGQTWDGVLPRPEMGYPPDLRWGTPPASVDRHTDSCQNITFPCTTYAGGKNARASRIQRQVLGLSVDRTWVPSYIGWLHSPYFAWLC